MIKNRDEIMSHGNIALRSVLIEIIESLLDRIRADRIVKSKVEFDGENLKIGDFKMPLNFENIYVVGFGKCSGEMALALEDILGDRIDGGMINTDHCVMLKKIKVQIASHPLPDEKTVEYSRKILDFLKNTGERDLLLILISGGASSLFEVPGDGVTLQEERNVVERMMRGGMNTEDLNRIRISLSSVKGGKMLSYIHSRCLSLILSDVIGDPKFVGSGPTFFQGKEKRCDNLVLADNGYARETALEIAEKMGFRAGVSPTILRGEPRDISSKIFKEFERSHEKIMVWGGETSVNSQNSTGIGGRNQELSLYLAKYVDGKNMAFSCIGTDGIDNTRDAAGGMVDGCTMNRLRNLNVDVNEALKNHDSHTVLKVLGDLIITGSTGTNLADICMGIKN